MGNCRSSPWGLFLLRISQHGVQNLKHMDGPNKLPQRCRSDPPFKTLAHAHDILSLQHDCRLFPIYLQRSSTSVCLVLNLERNATDKSHGANFWGFIAISLRAEPCPNDGNDQWHSDLQFSASSQASSQAYTVKFGCRAFWTHSFRRLEFYTKPCY